MPDYRHDLQFGAFIVPVARQADAVVELSRLADVAGLDIVSFQDHPYQSAFLDTWTLLSVVAAATTNVRVAPNVANLPLRPPVVLARSAASLDILSGGRVELGIGAGTYHDALVALGLPRLTAGQSVDALAEAVDVIRAIWRAEGRSTMTAPTSSSTASSPARRPRTTSRSGSAPTSRGCCGSPAPRPTAGYRA